MAWLTGELVKLERMVNRQDLVRRCLWRMDSFAAVFMATESARPHLYYNSFYSPEQAYYISQCDPAPSWTVACSGDYRIPSPLLRSEPDYCRLHFQIVLDPEGSAALVAPRYPPSQENREFALTTQNIRQDDMVKAWGLMQQLQALAHPDRMMQLARAATRDAAHVALASRDVSATGDPDFLEQFLDNPLDRPRQQSLEQQSRSHAASQAMNVQQQSAYIKPISMDAREIEVSSLAPVWLHAGQDAPELVLLRTVHIKRAGGVEELVQGVWVEWPSLRDEMLKQIADIFPSAQLDPGVGLPDQPERLATIPAVLRPGTPAGAFAGIGPVGRPLYIAWAGVIAALVAVGVVLRAIIDLGERRGRFVSAVTHELRTPLTTFCLYSEMLADGMVRDEEAKREYLGTLKKESQRLAKIVENVLCYARLAEVRASAHTQRTEALELLEHLTPALARRAGEAGMQLVTDTEPARGAVVDVDPQTVERILTNLVDNACKYARGYSRDGAGEDNRIHLTVRARPGIIEILVADHGPGISRPHRRAIFKAFNRANAPQQSSTPGLGLGLSLARGLARELGGDLRLAPLPADFASGTVMALVLPATWPAPAPRLAEASTPA